MLTLVPCRGGCSMTIPNEVVLARRVQFRFFFAREFFFTIDSTLIAHMCC